MEENIRNHVDSVISWFPLGRQISEVRLVLDSESLIQRT